MSSSRSIKGFMASAVLLAGAVLLGPSLQAQSGAQAVISYDSLVRNYNLITFGNASFSNYGDTEGGLAIGGNLTLTGNSASIATQPGKFGVSGDPTLYVAGQLSSNVYTNVNSGYASTPNATGWTWNNNDKRLTNGSGTLSLSNANIRTNPLTNAGPTDWNWSTVENSFKSVSNSLAAMTATGSISVSSGTLMFVSTGASPGDVVAFDLDANALSGMTYNGISFSNIGMTLPADVTYVINVANAGGKTLFGTKDNGANFNGGGYERLLWNILPDTDGSGSPVATSVTLGSREFQGSVLAPMVDVSNSDRVIVNGQVVAASYNHTGNELHYVGFDSSSVTFSAVPEPSTYGLAGLALCAGAIGFRAWRRRKLALVAK